MKVKITLSKTIQIKQFEPLTATIEVEDEVKNTEDYIKLSFLLNLINLQVKSIRPATGCFLHTLFSVIYVKSSHCCSITGMPRSKMHLSEQQTAPDSEPLL